MQNFASDVLVIEDSKSTVNPEKKKPKKLRIDRLSFEILYSLDKSQYQAVAG